MKTGIKVFLGLTGVAAAATAAYFIYAQQSQPAQSTIAQAITEAGKSITSTINNPASPYEGKFLNVKGSSQYWIVKDGMKHALPSGRAADYIAAGVFSWQGPWVSQQLVDSLPTGGAWVKMPTKADLSGVIYMSSKLLN